MRLETETTESETQFERLCCDLGWRLERVPRSSEQHAKTPDYDLHIGGKSLVIEIKEITRAHRGALASENQAFGPSGFTRIGIETLRKKIGRGAPQVKARSHGARPSIIVIYDQAKPDSRLRTSPQNFLAAMYGRPIMRFKVRNRKTIDHTRTDFSREHKFAPDSNTSVSAVASLWLRPDGLLALDVFHNVFAESVLDPGACS